MGLFTIYAVMQLSREDKARFERIAAALEALVAKVDAPGGEIPPELREAVGEQTQAAGALKRAVDQAGQGH